MTKGEKVLFGFYLVAAYCAANMALEDPSTAWRVISAISLIFCTYGAAEVWTRKPPKKLKKKAKKKSFWRRKKR